MERHQNQKCHIALPPCLKMVWTWRWLRPRVVDMGHMGIGARVGTSCGHAKDRAAWQGWGQCGVRGTAAVAGLQTGGGR